MSVAPASSSERVLVLMPTALDSERTSALLAEAGLSSTICREMAELCRELRHNTDAILLTDDAILNDTAGQLASAMRLQPAWSAIPVLVLAREGATEHLQRSASEALRSIIVVERPVRTRTLLSVVLSALRGRRHQYQIRDAILLREKQASLLSAEKERLRFALSAGGLGSWDFNLDTGELQCSDLCKAKYGRTPEQSFTYLDLQEAIHPDDRDEAAEALERTIYHGANYDVEYRVLWPNGETHWVMVRGRASYDALGVARRVAGISLDISERKQMEEALQRSQAELARQAEQLRSSDRRKDEFLATLAHELRNPLAPVRTGLDLLSAVSDPDTARRTTAVMQRQVSHMVRLIDDLLDVSRITRGKLELKKAPVTLGDIIDSALEASRPGVERARHTLEVSVADRSMTFDADHTRLAQVVSNLINNSSKYTPPGGRIELVATSREGRAHIEVRDNGVGIPEDRLSDVFDMFSQVNSPLHRTQGGLGIGLALVKSLVEMHGGTVTASSPGVGLGSTFTVDLPVIERPRSVAPPGFDMASLRPSGKPRVLIVDDNQDAAEMLSMMLEMAGYETRTSYESRQAIELVSDYAPAIVILDIGLPDMNGYEVARELRSRDSSPPLALIALTGWGTTEDKQKAAAAGFDVHLTKPVNAELLEAAIAKVRGQLRASSSGAIPA